MHVQKGATHNMFDLYGDVIDPMMAFLKRHGRAPWWSCVQAVALYKLNSVYP
jgi:hypothetical protein